MSETVFAADPTRLLIAAAAGIVLLLLLIIKFKFHPALSLLISALLIGLGAGMPVPTLVNTVEKGAGETLQGIVLLIGLGSLFGGILEVSGGAQCVAQTLVNRFGEKKAGIALGITGLVVGTTVFFEAGVVILIPLAFGLAKKTKKSTLYYVIPLLAGLATGFAFIPPSAGSVLVANMLGVDLGIMIAVGVPIGILSLIFAGILWSKFIGTKIHTGLPTTVSEVREEEEANLPKFSKLLYELDSVHGIGLIERYRQGNNRPSVIYVKNFVKRIRGKPVRYFASGTPETGNPDCKELEIRIARNWKSGTQKNRSPDCKNLDGSNTKINKTEKNHTDKSKGNTPALEEKFSQYGRFKNVVLSEAELQELMTIFPWDYQKRIDHLSVYMKSSGKEYQNHFATICLWAERDGARAGMDKYEFQEGESL